MATDLQEKSYTAWRWLEDNHEWATNSLYIAVVKVDPKSKEVVDDKEKNTLVNYWLEAGPWENGQASHDTRLDCGADTFEEAVIKLAELVKKHYGQKSDAETGKKIQEN